MIRILLVEDDPVIRDTTSYFLKCQQNFEVVCADTGGEALSHAREKLAPLPHHFYFLSGRYRHSGTGTGIGRR